MAALLFVMAGGAWEMSALAASPSPRAAAAAKSGKRSKHRVKREKGQKAPTPERITEIQQALAKDGSFAGTANGKWDAATTDALRRYQEAQGLNASGKLDAPTLQKLGLGSETAGVAAPLPQVNPTSSLLQGAHPQR